MDVESFVVRWQNSQASERANKDSYLKELCRVLGVPEPDAKTGDADRDVYVFEADARILTEKNKPKFGSMDLYRQGCFVFEAKQGSEKGSKKVGTAKRGTPGWAIAMTEALGQALQYARTLEDPPPFVIVADLGYCFDLYACFDGTGAYKAFPNAQKNRLRHGDLGKHLDLLRTIWLDPKSLDPNRYAKRVTREIAYELAALAKDLEDSGNPQEVVSKFLMRCVFTMFAEDVGLLPDKVFGKYIDEIWLQKPSSFKSGVTALWRAMNSGEDFYVLGKLLRFNGGLFTNPVALDLNEQQLKILKRANAHDWAEVEPAIFGSLIERALDPRERHKLGAHFTPTEYVRRLLVPTIEEPLRDDWDKVRVRVREYVAPGEPAKPANIKKAVEAVQEFQRKLCSTTVLDPACGSGNFLYVALHLLKEIESEVLGVLDDLGVKQQALGEELSVTPRQFLGIEIRPGSKDIAELVLWIGYLQWHHKMYGGTKKPPEPILRDYRNIECRDAVLEWNEPPRDRKVVRARKLSRKRPRKKPSAAALISLPHVDSPARAPAWPQVDFIVGNPPFLGSFKMRQDLGDAYVEALRAAWPEVPKSSDLVMYWWDMGARLVRSGTVRRMGLVTTTSITQKFNRRVVQRHMEGDDRLSLLYGASDHPWVISKQDHTEGSAQVRIAMTVVAKGDHPGVLAKVIREVPTTDGSIGVDLSTTTGRIRSDLTIGADLVTTKPLTANEGLSCPGVKLHGSGFIVTQAQATQLGLGRIGELTRHIRPYLNGRDLMAKPRGVLVIDLFQLSSQDVMRKFPEVYQWLLQRVKPKRDRNNRSSYRAKWWIFGEPRSDFRPALVGLKRYIATTESARRRFFAFVDGSVIPDNTMVNIAADDGFTLGVLSSRVHLTWALAAGGRLGVGNDPRYNKTRCFDPFPFPACSDEIRKGIAKLAEELDAHRKRQQQLYPKLAMTKVYGVLAMMRAGTALRASDTVVHEQGLLEVLKTLHDELDAAVFDAYGWPSTISDQEILQRCVLLNAERADEESRGVVRWLRPKFQKQQHQPHVDEATSTTQTTPTQLELMWPEDLPEQVASVRDVLLSASGMLTANDVAGSYKGASASAVVPALRTLEALGIAACYKNGTVRWKGLAKTTGDRASRETREAS